MENPMKENQGILAGILLLQFVYLTAPVGAEDHLLSSDRAANACVPTEFKIVIDVGHTTEAFGALSARGVTEYQFNLELGTKIEEMLHDADFGRTSLTVMHGVGRGQLLERSARANAMKPDLFLSIHHDDVQPVYYEEWTYNGTKRHFSDRFAGYSLFISYKNQFADLSLAYAKLLGQKLIEQGMKFSKHHAENVPGEHRQLLDTNFGVYRYDQLSVLKNTRAAAVLLEAGVIVNRNEEMMMSSPERQQLIGSAVVAATRKFCDLEQSRRASAKATSQ